MTPLSGFAVTETLKNGVTVTIRTLRPDDRERIATAVRHLDRESVYRRLFSYRNELTEAGLDRIMAVDPALDVALVVTAGADEAVVACGRYMAANADGSARTAELAFTVDEHFRGLGLASRLLGHLIAIAREHGIAAFEADVLAGNKAMLDVFARCGLPMRTRHEGATLHVTLPLRDDRA